MPASATPVHPDAAALLGVVSDAEVAARCGVTPAIARGWRLRAGLPPAPKGIPIPDNAREILGTCTDIEAGELLDVSSATAHKWRVALNIPPSSPCGARSVHVGAPPLRAEILAAARAAVDAAHPVPGGMCIPPDLYAALHAVVYPTK